MAKRENKKKILRKKYLKIRKKFFFKKFNIHSIFKIINKNFSKSKIVVAAYFPSNYEVDITNFIKLASLKKYQTALPVIYTGNNMKFKIWHYKDPLIINKYGMSEPHKSNKTVYPDCFLVPLVAYDNNLNRIGYGKGFYDKALKKISKIKKIITIGIAYSFQRTNNIPINRHDYRLDYILNEKRIISRDTIL